jgi:hypothetical protein
VVGTVLAWHEALNAGDVERLADLSHPEIGVGGPRGGARGRQVLKDWVGRANISLEPLRLYARGPTVVVEERATWRDARTGETTGATVFGLAGGLVSGVFRHDGLEDALASAGLDHSDWVGPE